MFAAWGLVLLVAAWRPRSWLGWFLVGPSAAEGPANSVKRYWVGGLGVALIVMAIFFELVARL